MGLCHCKPKRDQKDNFDGEPTEPPLDKKRSVPKIRDIDHLRTHVDKVDGSLDEIEKLDIEIDFFTAEDFSDDEDEFTLECDVPMSPQSPRDELSGVVEQDVAQCREGIKEWIGPEDAPCIGSAAKPVPRCPLEKMPEASFCASAPEVFNLRVGPDYDRHGKKAPSIGSIYSPIGLDVYRSSKPVMHVGSKLRIPTLPYSTNSPHAPPVFILNMQVPVARPSMMSKDLQGECINVIISWVMPRHTADAFGDRENLSGSLALLEQWCVRAFEDDKFRGRFKVMAKVPHGVPRPLRSYNGKPTLVTGSGKVFRGEGYIEVDCNIANWCYLARVSIYSLWAAMKEQRGDFGCTIESRENMYMPEKILGCIQFAQIDLDHAPQWPFPL
jgi:hypothetical protein